MHSWSNEQQAIFNWFQDSSAGTLGTHKVQNLVVRARAGTGKTTTILHGVTLAPEKSILIAAFSKIIQEEISKKLTKMNAPQGIKAQTLHSVGLQLIRRFRDRIGVSFSNDRAEAITEQVCGLQVPDAIKRLVTNLHTKGREIAPHAVRLGDLTNIQIQFDCVPDEQWENSGFPAEFVEQKALEAMALAAQVKSGDIIDGSDMIFLPVRNGWLMGLYDMVVVDEAQDMTTAQLEIAQGVCRKGGRICVVGDDRQAIFGFRGADSESLDRLKQELNAGELGLKTTYRCGHSIVEIAKSYVPDYEAALGNPMGEVEYLNTSHLIAAAQPGDYILSRVNAPLVMTAMQLLKSGKRTRIAGRDIGKSLVKIIRGLKARSIPDLLSKLEAWGARKVSRVEAQMASATNGRKRALQSKIEEIQEQVVMLSELTEGLPNVASIERRIEELFSDDGLGVAGTITCSSVHRAKGLEADRVFILEETLREYSQEEKNICYVAITRAKQTLVFVNSQIAE